MTDGVELWRGCCNAWECDEMGHMNVRFYLARAHEGLAGLLAAMGMEGALRQGAEATAIAMDHHVRFLREARAGAPMVMTGGVLTLQETDARLVQIIRHVGSGEIAAAIQTVVRHVAGREARGFPWSESTRRRAARLTTTVPEGAMPRSLGLAPSGGLAAMTEADRLGLARIGAGAFTPADTDIFGRVRPDVIIGRISDSVPNLAARATPRRQGEGGDPPRRVGGAVLEYRLAYLAQPRAGDRFEIRSGLAAVERRTRRFVHWIVDPQNGAAWASAEAVAVALDLDARRILDLDDETLERLRGECVLGIAF